MHHASCLLLRTSKQQRMHLHEKMRMHLYECEQHDGARIDVALHKYICLDVVVLLNATV
jgi:hypothetical protein